MLIEPEFQPAPVRLVGELAERVDLAPRLLTYGHRFLDDVLRGLLPHDLALIGAPTGAGKTELAVMVAKHNARKGKRVYYFALEAEPREIERRTKYALLVEAAYRAIHPNASDLNYPDWIIGRCEHVCRAFNGAVDRQIAEQFSKLHTYYRGSKFDEADVRKQFAAIEQHADLIVIDHAGYIDTGDDNELRGTREMVKLIRDLALQLGKPVVLVAHLRKRDHRAKQAVASIDDFHGSSDLVKIATQVIMLEPATCFEPPAWYVAPTFVHVPKDRRGGAPGVVAFCQFDKRARCYSADYTLGRVMDSGTRWEPIRLADVPRWAHGHRELPA